MCQLLFQHRADVDIFLGEQLQVLVICGHDEPPEDDSITYNLALD